MTKLQKAKEYSAYISQLGIKGIILTGGVSRSTDDEHSDIDLTIYLTPKKYEKWMKKSPISLGDHQWNETWFDIEIQDYSKLANHRWSQNERWEKKTAKILYDPDGKIKALLKEKVKWGVGEQKALMKEAASLANWFIKYIPITWLKRGDIMQAHYALNKGIGWICDYIFLKNKSFIPYGKWKMNLVFKQKVPKGFEQKIKDAIIIKGMDKKEVLRRQKVLKSILKSLKL